MFESSTTFLNVCKWALKHPIITNEEQEKAWGNTIIECKKPTAQWTTKLGEYFVEELLQKIGYNVQKGPKVGRYNPDRETDEYIIEVKTRNWTTTGTAGEKVFGTPLKYASIPKSTGKPLLIVCVAFQEYEFIYGNTPIFGDRVHADQVEFLDFYKSKNIYFVPCSYLIYLYLSNQKISLDNIYPMYNILPQLSLIPDSSNLLHVEPQPLDIDNSSENTLQP